MAFKSFLFLLGLILVVSLNRRYFHSLAPKQIIHLQVILHNRPRIFVFQQPKRSQHHEKYRFFRFGTLNKRCDLIPQNEVISLGDLVGIDRKFDFKKIDHPVFSIDDQIDLGAT